MSGEADLRGPLAARLVPLLVLVGATVALSVPLAHHAMGCAELRESAVRDASDIAQLLAREAEQRPVLWRYDSIRVLQHLRAYQERPHVARIEIVDDHDRLLDSQASLDEQGLLWSGAAIAVRGDVVGRVWVGMRPDTLRMRSLAVLAAFGALAIVLVLLVHAITMRSAAHAETRIDSLVEGLARARVEQRVRALGARAVSAQEDERRAIARDLHDSVGQALTAIRIQAEVLSSRTDDAEEVRRAARRIADASDETLEEVRRAIARLGPAVLGEVGLTAAITRLLETVREGGPDGVAVEAKSAIEELAPMSAALETTCYRIAQEALTNVARHAGAKRVVLTLAREGDDVVLEIHDDGRGHGEGEELGHGLRSMRERAELLGGTLSIASALDGGTRVRAVLPLRSLDADDDADDDAGDGPTSTPPIA